MPTDYTVLTDDQLSDEIARAEAALAGLEAERRRRIELTRADPSRWDIEVRPNTDAEWALSWRGRGRKRADETLEAMVGAGVGRENIRIKETLKP